jgi:hypothetical protein
MHQFPQNKTTMKVNQFATYTLPISHFIVYVQLLHRGFKHEVPHFSRLENNLQVQTEGSENISNNPSYAGKTCTPSTLLTSWRFAPIRAMQSNADADFVASSARFPVSCFPSVVSHSANMSSRSLFPVESIRLYSCL